MSRRALVLGAVLGLTAASAAGVAIGVVAVVAAERMRALLGEVEWDDGDEGWPAPTRRLRACVESWPECQEGLFDPLCCRWPKSCSATVYDPERVTEDDLEAR